MPDGDAITRQKAGTAILEIRGSKPDSATIMQAPSKELAKDAMEWMIVAPMIAVAAAVTLWMAGAIGFDVCDGGRCGLAAAPAWIARRRRAVHFLAAALAAASSH